MNRFERIDNLIGQQKREILHNKTVMVVGLGGVGDYAVESLARSGIGKLIIIDKDDVALRGAFAFILKISDAILKENNDIEGKIENIVGIVKERESNILGGNSRLDSGMAFDAMGDYEDTFRWEYRPEIERMEAQESCDKDTINDLDKDKVDESNADEINEENAKDKNKLHNMCARYYIYELFFEK